jgi:NADH/NAD ratio-sensing transcriptional regulator Rex
MNAIALNALIDINDNGNTVIDIAGGFGDQWGELMNPLTEYANVKKMEKIKERVESVKNITDNKKEASDLYLEISTVHTNDSQNVHDTNVNKQVKAILELIISNTTAKGDCTNEIVEFYKGRENYEFRALQRTAVFGPLARE